MKEFEAYPSETEEREKLNESYVIPNNADDFLEQIAEDVNTTINGLYEDIDSLERNYQRVIEGKGEVENLELQRKKLKQEMDAIHATINKLEKKWLRLFETWAQEEQRIASKEELS